MLWFVLFSFFFFFQKVDLKKKNTAKKLQQYQNQSGGLQNLKVFTMLPCICKSFST